MTEKEDVLLFSRVVAGILIVLSILFMYAVYLCNILPFKYFFSLLGILVFIVVFNSYFLIKEKPKIWLKLVLSFFSIAIISILSISLFYIERTYNFLEKIKTRGYITEKYYVIVNKNSDYYNIEDLKDKDVGAFNEGIELYTKAIEKYKSLVQSYVHEYEDVDDMSRKIMRNDLDAIILSKVHKETIDEQLRGFKDSVRIIYEIDIKAKSKEVEHPEINIKQDVFTVFLAGSDSRGSLTARSNCDVNMLITVNPNTYEILLVSIPRDYYVQLHGTTGNRDKLTHAGYYGVDMSINTIQDFLNIKIDYYIKVGFQAVKEIVDLIGGVDVYSDKSFRPFTNSRVYINQGMNHMNGDMALAFARERYTYLEGDRHRIQNQQDVLSAVFKKMISTNDLLLKYTSFLSILSKNLETNVNPKDVSRIVSTQIDNMPSWTIKSYNLNGFDSWGYTYSYGGAMLWVMEPNYDTINAASYYINGMREMKNFSELGL